MSDKNMAEPTRTEQEAWLQEACAAIGVDYSLLDVSLVLELTKQVAHRFVRPMAPVSAYALGVAVGLSAAAEGPVDQRALVERIVETLPPQKD
ncbi:DUF6457 domain-containing protein [Calidifontibacter indicus]|uniref:DUF6457 domain-containing protein n=1 Tax=Calidifontibacter indicus TaxID=419650 RepID=A0A3D9USX8_9MICO|nr:DUF6457 domain-containing protein [Calidifontibacter indicus]REF31623.1 hypothetical protein DFJ65_2695 [Calidifontibacter indicus]